MSSSKYYSFAIKGTPDARAENLEGECQYTLDSTDGIGQPPIVIVEAITINGHVVDHWLEEIGGLESFQEQLEKEILASIQE